MPVERGGEPRGAAVRARAQVGAHRCRARLGHGVRSGIPRPRAGGGDRRHGKPDRVHLPLRRGHRAVRAQQLVQVGDIAVRGAGAPDRVPAAPHGPLGRGGAPAQAHRGQRLRCRRSAQGSSRGPCRPGALPDDSRLRGGTHRRRRGGREQGERLRRVGHAAPDRPDERGLEVPPAPQGRAGLPDAVPRDDQRLRAPRDPLRQGRRTGRLRVPGCQSRVRAHDGTVARGDRGQARDRGPAHGRAPADRDLRTGGPDG